MSILHRISAKARACAILLLSVCIAAAPSRALGAGTWAPLANQATDSQGNVRNIGVMLLLSDGTVLCADANNFTNWYRLIPDEHGSYTNGTWSTNAIGSMNYQRNLFAADVLPDGRVFVAGGEWPSDTETASSEIYDPIANTWATNNPSTNLFDPSQGNVFSDMVSVVIPDGRVLMAPVGPKTNGATLIFDPKSNLWSGGPVLTNSQGNQDECSWAKLADGSILTIDGNNTSSQRYIPALNKWIPDRPAPISIWYNSEIGPALTLPNGSVFFVAGTGTNLVYKPSPLGGTNFGTWSVGPVSPNDLRAADVPGAMMVNGKVLMMLATNCVNGGCFWPWNFYEYDYTDGSMTPAPAPASDVGPPPLYIPWMLDLPDGTVLLSISTPQLNVYVPDGSPLTAGKPAITSITPNSDGSFHLVGTGLNGISEGAAEGDDGQMATDYPLVRMTNVSSGLVYYARTHDWSGAAIQTQGTSESTEFTLPTSLPPGDYSVVVVANGIASNPYTKTFYGPIWVDFNFSGLPFQLGTYDFPYNTLPGGVSAAPTNGLIFVKPGTSTERPTINKPVTIVAVGAPATIGHQ